MRNTGPCSTPPSTSSGWRCLPPSAATTSCRARITRAGCRPRSSSATAARCSKTAFARFAKPTSSIHTDRHLIGLPRLVAREAAAVLVEAPFALYQTDQEGETRLFATGLYRDRIAAADGELKFRDKLVLLDSFAVPSLLATPL